MNVLVRDRAFIINPTKKAKDFIEEKLTFPNPKYQQAMRSGMSHVWHSPTLEFFEEASSGSLLVPKGFISRFKREFNCSVKYDTVKGEKQNFKFHGVLRGYQKGAVEDMISNIHGVLQASTGAGKTVMGTYMIARRDRTTIVLVHNKELLYQWQEAVKKFLHFDCGLIGDKHFEIKPITVGIINSVKNNLEKLFHEFGHVVCDETHRCPSGMWTETLLEFENHYQLGLSATPYRSDGLDLAIPYFVGPIMHVVDPEELHAEGAVLIPKIIRVQTDLEIDNQEKIPYHSLVSSLVLNDERNKLIVKKILNDLAQYKENILVVTDRVEHAKSLQNRLKNLTIRAELLHAKISPVERAEIVKRVKAGKVQVLISTLSLIGEGFDAPDLSALFLTTPVKFKGRLLQVIGRVLRPKKGKIARVYDFRDMKVQKFMFQAFSRDKSYKEVWGDKA